MLIQSRGACIREWGAAQRRVFPTVGGRNGSGDAGEAGLVPLEADWRVAVALMSFPEGLDPAARVAPPALAFWARSSYLRSHELQA